MNRGGRSFNLYVAAKALAGAGAFAACGSVTGNVADGGIAGTSGGRAGISGGSAGTIGGAGAGAGSSGSGQYDPGAPNDHVDVALPPIVAP